MNRTQVWYLHSTVALLALSGVIFAWMKYGMTSDDPFAVANHPLQPHMLSAHVLLAPLVVFGLGWIFALHIWPRWSRPPESGRRSGSTAFLLIAPMVVSGYLLQVGSSETLHTAARVIHWISSGLFTVGYALHVIGKRSVNGRYGGNGNGK